MSYIIVDGKEYYMANDEYVTTRCASKACGDRNGRQPNSLFEEIVDGKKISHSFCKSCRDAADKPKHKRKK